MQHKTAAPSVSIVNEFSVNICVERHFNLNKIIALLGLCKNKYAIHKYIWQTFHVNGWRVEKWQVRWEPRAKMKATHSLSNDSGNLWSKEFTLSAKQWIYGSLTSHEHLPSSMRFKQFVCGFCCIFLAHFYFFIFIQILIWEIALFGICVPSKRFAFKLKLHHGCMQNIAVMYLYLYLALRILSTFSFEHFRIKYVQKCQSSCPPHLCRLSLNVSKCLFQWPTAWRAAI